VFTSGTDPVAVGLVRSLSRPEANVTGVNWFNGELGPKHLELARELVPGAALVAVLVNPNDPAEAMRYEVPIREAAGRVGGLRIAVFKAKSASEIDQAFETLVQQQASAVLVAADPFLSTRATQLVVLAARYNVPIVYPNRETAMIGGLISYGNDISDAYRRAGIYVGRILKGGKPVDLPVDRATKFELVINLQTAKTLKLDIPTKLLALADEVIE
jgi:putative ABC transport system substrate-binding protein